MIHTIRTVAVGDQESKIDSPIILYRGDREVEVEFTINGSKFTFTNGGNVIKSTNATHGQLVINTPTGENMFSEVTECHNGKVVFIITKEMIDELVEVGFYSFQIRLFDESQVSRVTIPPVLKGIDIRNPIAAEDETNVVDIGLVDYAVIVKDEFEDLSTFLPDGNYNKTEWESKDVISGAKLNKIEDALYNINSNMEATDLALLNKVEGINRRFTTDFNKINDDVNLKIDNIERVVKKDIDVLDADMIVFEDKINRDLSYFKKCVNEDLYEIDKNKPDKNEVRLKSTPYTLNECDAEMLAAIQNKSGETSFELSSIPKDESVTFGKIERDLIETSTYFKEVEVVLKRGYYDTTCGSFGAIKDNSGYKSIEYECKEGQIYNCDCRVSTSSLSAVVFYKSDGLVLSRLNAGVIDTYENYEFVVPKDACFLTITSPSSLPPVLRKLTFIDSVELLSDIEKIKNTQLLPFTKNTTLIDSVVAISMDNSDILENKIYDTNGGFQNNNSFSTLYIKLNDNVVSVNLKSIIVGVYGGAFVDGDKQWIKSFSTRGVDEYMDKPENAGYIGISLPNDNKYNGYYFIAREESHRIKIDNLDVSDAQDPTSFSSNHWKNKKVLWLGTSVPFGQYATKSYAKEASDILGFNLLNASAPGLAVHTNDDGTKRTYGSLVLSKAEYLEQGVSIPSIPIPYIPGGSYNDYYRTYENVFTDETKSYDLYVFDLAPNNSNFGMDDWEAFDKKNWGYIDGSSFQDHRTSFVGGLLFLMDKLYALNPKARIVFVLGSEFVYKKAKEVFEVISDEYKIPIIDVWGKINLTPMSKPYIYSKQGTDQHPTTYAHELLGRMLANELLLII